MLTVIRGFQFLIGRLKTEKPIAPTVGPMERFNSL